MGFWEFASDYWWLVFPLGGFVWSAVHGAGNAIERRRRDRHSYRLERMRLRYGGDAEQARPGVTANPSVDAAAVRRALAEHDDVSKRWLEYELDAAKLIDFPLMTDMREQLTRDFHRAKRRADALRPDDGATFDDPAASDEYRAAVADYQDAFEIAEAEARRRSQRDFSADERKRLQTARQLVGLAVDEAASAAERQSAYRRARAELDGLIVLPDATTDDLEARIAGAIGPGATQA